MSLVISQEAIKTLAGHFKILSGKTVLLVDNSFNYDDAYKTILGAFPENLSSVRDAKCVLASFTLPDAVITETAVEFVGPVTIKSNKTGTICGFIIFDGDFDQRIVSTDATIVEKLLCASNSVGIVGDSEMMIFDSLQLSKNQEVTLFHLSLTMDGI